jgi:hypothetical protein
MKKPRLTCFLLCLYSLLSLFLITFSSSDIATIISRHDGWEFVSYFLGNFVSEIVGVPLRGLLFFIEYAIGVTLGIFACRFAYQFHQLASRRLTAISLIGFLVPFAFFQTLLFVCYAQGGSTMGWVGFLGLGLTLLTSWLLLIAFFLCLFFRKKETVTTTETAKPE